MSYFVALNKKFQVPILGNIPKGYDSFPFISTLIFLLCTYPLIQNGNRMNARPFKVFCYDYNVPYAVHW